MVLMASFAVGCGTTSHHTSTSTDMAADAFLEIDCGDAASFFEAGDFESAAEALRLRATESPDLITDLCLSRALIGTGQAGSAFSLLSSLRSESEVEANPALSATVCAYSNWAQFQTQAGIAETCDAQVEPSFIVSGDHLALELLPFERAATTSSLTEVAAVGDALLRRGDLAESTRLWIVFEGVRVIAGAEPAALSDASVAMPASSGSLAELLNLNAQLTATLAAGESSSSGSRHLIDQIRALLVDQLNAPWALSQFEGLSGGSEQREARFGCVLSLTGAYRPAARAALAGMLLAQGAFGQEEPLSQLVVVDGGDTAESAAAAVAQLDSLGVLAIVGPAEPRLAEIVRREAEAREIPVILLTHAPEQTATGRWGFGFFANARAEALALLDVVNLDGSSRVAIAMPMPTPDYMVRLVDAFTVEAQRRGISVDRPRLYTVGDEFQSEAQSLAESLVRDSFDALLIADTAAHATTIAAYLAVEDIWARPPQGTVPGGRRGVLYLGNSFWHNPDFLNSGPDYLAGGVFPTWIPVELGRRATVDFSERFEATYGRRAGVLGAFGFDALAMLRHLALDQNIRSRDAFRTALDGLDTVGATGDIRFGEDRSSQAEPVLLRVAEGGFEPL